MFHICHYWMRVYDISECKLVFLVLLSTLRHSSPAADTLKSDVTPPSFASHLPHISPSFRPNGKSSASMSYLLSHFSCPTAQVWGVCLYLLLRHCHNSQPDEVSAFKHTTEGRIPAQKSEEGWFMPTKVSLRRLWAPVFHVKAVKAAFTPLMNNPSKIIQQTPG